MTDLEILQSAIQDLKKVVVPMELTEAIGIPVYNAHQKLVGLYNNILQLIQRQQEEAAKAQEAVEPEIEVVSEDEVPEDAEVEQIEMPLDEN